MGKIKDDDFDRITNSFPLAVDCPTCGGTTEYILDGVTYDCDCETQKLLQKHYFAANIGREYHDICLKDFVGENRERVVELVDGYLDRFEDNFHYGKGLTFHGGFGTGKTFAMNCVLKELIKWGRDVYFITFDDLINTWGASWNDDLAKKLLTDKLKRVEVLGLDELRTDNRNASGFLADGLDNVIRHRTSNLLPTLITTNLAPVPLESNFSKAFSVLSARNNLIVLDGKDQRKSQVKERVEGLVSNGERRPIC